MTSEELTQIVQQDESQYTEFKLESEKQADLAEVIVSFANAEGGNLLVGVTDDQQIIGVQNVKSIVDRLHAAARRTDPSLHNIVKVMQVDCGGKIVVVAQVPDDLDATYSLSGRFRIREGSFNRLMSSADVVEHAVRRGTLCYEETAVRQAGLEDLDQQKIKDFLARRLQAGVPERPVDQILQDMKAAVLDGDNEWRPSVGGTLFFGNWPQLHLSHTTILAARIVGPRGTQIVDRETIEGRLPDMIDGAVHFLRRNIRHGLLIGHNYSARAQEVDEYPQDAVREALINACCHRDYQERSPIQFKIYDDRIVITNPGGLLPGLDIANLEGKHRTRNPMLADWLHAMGYVERFGVGVIRMAEAMENAGLPAPQFVNSPDQFEVTLIGPGPSHSVAQAQVNQSENATSQPDANVSTAQYESLPWYKQPLSSIYNRAYAR